MTHQPPRASVRLFQKPWASALRLIPKCDSYFSNAPYSWSCRTGGQGARARFPKTRTYKIEMDRLFGSWARPSPFDTVV